MSLLRNLIPLVACLLLVSVAQARNDAQDDAAAYLAEIAQTMDKARAGDLGSLSTAELDALERSQRRITQLLQGHTQISELGRTDRIALYNVQELMLAIIRKQPQQQHICRSSTPNYTRIRQYDCANWADREARKRQGRTTTRVMQFGHYEGD